MRSSKTNNAPLLHCDVITLRDIALLEPPYVKNRLPIVLGYNSAQLLAKALFCNFRPEYEYIVGNLPPDIEHAAQEESSFVDTDDRLTLQDAENTLLDLLFWDIFYRKAPHEYDMFAQSQRLPLDKLFPPEQYFDTIVADIGCGTGRLIDHLVESARSVVAVDAAPTFVRFCRRKYRFRSNVQVLGGSFASTRLRPDSVDQIVSCLAFSTSESRGGLTGIQELRRVLRTGGSIRLVVAGGDTEVFLRNNHFNPVEVTEVTKWTIPEKPSPLLNQVYTRVLLAWHEQVAKTRPSATNRHFADEANKRVRPPRTSLLPNILIQAWEWTKR